jgi:putative membrane protein insertion efficiency factor
MTGFCMKGTPPHSKPGPLWLLTLLLKVPLWGYRKLVSPLLGQRCRFYPSCSQYALEALETFGPFRGSLLTFRRLLRCHPFHPGGVDNVPPPP